MAAAAAAAAAGMAVDTVADTAARTPVADSVEVMVVEVMEVGV